MGASQIVSGWCPPMLLTKEKYLYELNFQYNIFYILVLFKIKLYKMHKPSGEFCSGIPKKNL